MPAVHRRRVLLSALACLLVASGACAAPAAHAVGPPPVPWPAPRFDSEVPPSPVAAPGQVTARDLDGVPVVVPPGVPVVEAAGDVPVDVYLVPHQDDELLSMGAAIHASTRAGHHVWVTPYMDGSGTGVCGKAGGTCTHGAWRGVPAPVFSGRRDEELLRSLEALGVPPEHVVPDPGTGARVPDGALTPELAATIVGTALARFPGATITSMSFVDHHSDHRWAGVELRRAALAGLVAPDRARFAMYRPYWQWQPGRRLVPDDTEAGDARALYRLAYGAPQDAVVVPCTEQDGCVDAVRRAVEAYRRPYGIGWASVSGSFESLLAVPAAVLHSWRTVPYDVGDLEVRSSGPSLAGTGAADGVTVRGVCSVRPVGTVTGSTVTDPVHLVDDLDRHSADRVLGRLATVTLGAAVPSARSQPVTAQFVAPGTWQAVVPRSPLGDRADVRCSGPSLAPASTRVTVAAAVVTLRVVSGGRAVTADGPAPEVCAQPHRQGLSASVTVAAGVPAGSRVSVTPVAPAPKVRGGSAPLGAGRAVVVPLTLPGPRSGARYAFRVAFEASSAVVVPPPVTVTVCVR